MADPPHLGLQGLRPLEVGLEIVRLDGCRTDSKWMWVWTRMLSSRDNQAYRLRDMNSFVIHLFINQTKRA